MVKNRPDIEARIDAAMEEQPERGIGSFVGGVREMQGKLIVSMDGVFSASDLRAIANAMEPRAWWRFGK
jgi:hypothetical protein